MSNFESFDITVYITNYNYDKYLEQAIESVLKQKNVNFELLIIDDGSKDNSREIIEKYRDNPIITIIYQQNKGLNITNNIALRIAKGKYIMRLDADDYLEEDALYLLSRELENDDELGLIFPDYYIVDTHGERIERHHRHDFKEEVSLYDQAAHGACTMIRVDFLKALGGYNESYKCQDGYELWVKFIQHYKVKNLNTPLFNYRQHGVNLTSNQNRILTTRAQINADFVESNAIKVDSLAIIPVRLKSDKYFDLKLNGETLLNIKIKQALQAKNIRKVVLACRDEEVLNTVDQVLIDNDKFEFYRRSEKSIRYNESLGTTVKEVFDFLGEEMQHIHSTVILDVRFPLISTMNIDDAVNTMHLFKSDSLISVRTFPNVIFQHNGAGMRAIMEQDKFTKLEREQLYEHVGGITVMENDSFLQNGKIVHGKVGHIILDKRNSFGIEDELDLKVIETIINEE